GRVARAVLADGPALDVDFVLVGIGVAANAELAEAAGLALSPAGGIEVDAACRTADPAIFAAGDCASLPWRGARIRLESVQNAIEQGEAAAAAVHAQAASARGTPHCPPSPPAPSSTECSVCMDGVNTHVLVPCGHKGVCAGCAARVRTHGAGPIWRPALGWVCEGFAGG
ncbi:MAG: FAD-dependent oxidoreductase, partial [Pseudomonadota bacterium]|nr:FAD-dependent oxidoreductase [Pseudomonadota bacterium]